jgi:hypothetical protein
MKYPNLILRIVSGSFLMFVGFFLWRHSYFKKKHPYPLFGTACLAQASVLTSPRFLMEPFRMDQIKFLAGSVWIELDDYWRIYHLYLLTDGIHSATYIIYLVVYLSLTTLLYVDLFLIIRNPIYPSKRRTKYYYLITLFITSIFLVSYLIALE